MTLLLGVEGLLCVLFAVAGFGLWSQIRAGQLAFGSRLGFRTSTTMVSEQAWRWAHQEARPGLLATGALAVVTLGMIAALWFGARMQPTAVAVGAAGLICVIGVFALSANVAHRAGRDIHT